MSLNYYFIDHADLLSTMTFNADSLLSSGDILKPQIYQINCWLFANEAFLPYSQKLHSKAVLKAKSRVLFSQYYGIE